MTRTPHRAKNQGENRSRQEPKVGIPDLVKRFAVHMMTTRSTRYRPDSNLRHVTIRRSIDRPLYFPTLFVYLIPLGLTSLGTHPLFTVMQGSGMMYLPSCPTSDCTQMAPMPHPTHSLQLEAPVVRMPVSRSLSQHKTDTLEAVHMAPKRACVPYSLIYRILNN